MRYRPNGSDWWPEQDEPKPIEEIIRMYEAGKCGTWFDPDEVASAWSYMDEQNNGFHLASDLCTDRGWADSAAGKLVLNFLPQAILFPGSFPGAAQERGDCVSHGASGAARTVISQEIWYGRPDEVTGEVEGVPELPTKGITEGVVSSAYQWWCRRRSGDGWTCATAARTLINDGVMLMKNYPDLGFDLTEYSYAATNKYARSGPPRDALELSHQHQIRKMIEVDTIPALRDLMYNTACGVFDCGSQGWSNTRDEFGVSKRSGSWSHSMKVSAIDDRDVVKQKYGDRLVLSDNNWGKWNRGGRDIIDSAKLVPSRLKQRWINIDLVNSSTGNIMIPHGTCWIREKQFMRRYMVAMVGAEGWKARTDNILV